MILWRNTENYFYHFDSDPRFTPFLLYVRWKSGVTFVWRCFSDEGCKNGYFQLKNLDIFLIFAQNIDGGCGCSNGYPQSMFSSKIKKTSSPKGNDAHLRAIIQSEKKCKHHVFSRLRVASSLVRGLIWPNFKLIQALMYVINTCKYEKDPIKNNREKVASPFFKL